MPECRPLTARTQSNWRVSRVTFAANTTIFVAMSDPHIAIPVREPSATSADDSILPFAVEALDVRGRVVRLGPALDTILTGTTTPRR